jgi:hypothetical protein
MQGVHIQCFQIGDHGLQVLDVSLFLFVMRFFLLLPRLLVLDDTFHLVIRVLHLHDLLLERHDHRFQQRNLVAVHLRFTIEEVDLIVPLLDQPLLMGRLVLQLHHHIILLGRLGLQLTNPLIRLLKSCLHRKDSLLQALLVDDDWLLNFLLSSAIKPSRSHPTIESSQH